jgi:hypothetical protein
MAIPWIGDRFRSPLDRAGRRRRGRSQPQRQEDSQREDPVVVRNRRRRNTSIGIGAVLISVVIGIVAFGFYQEFYRPPRVWAGSVNNVEFSMGDLVSRIRVLQGVSRYQGGRVDLSTVPFEYLQNLINAEILRQASPQLGIAPTDAEIVEELRIQFGPAEAPGQESDPGQLDREYQNNYQTFLTATGLSDGDYRIITEEQLSLRRLVAAMAQNIESPLEQVEVQWIRLPLDRNAQGSAVQPDDVSRRLAIEDFGVVAREVSQSAGFARADGYVGWVPRDTFPELEQVLYGDPERGLTALAPGETSRPIFTSDGIYIIKMLSGPQIQELDPRVRTKLNIELVRQWQELQLKNGSESGAVRMNFNSKLYGWVADQVFITAPRIPADQAQPGQPGVPLR